VTHGVIDRVDAVHRAYVAIGKIVQKQAFILAFSDTFYVLGVALIVALLQTLLTKREQYHSNVLMQSVSMLEPATRARIEKLTQYFMSHGVADHVDATHRAIVAIGKIVQKQAFILAFSDLFFLLGTALIVALVASLFLKKPGHLENGDAH